jgi:hypothetical protein
LACFKANWILSETFPVSPPACPSVARAFASDADLVCAKASGESVSSPSDSPMAAAHKTDRSAISRLQLRGFCQMESCSFSNGLNSDELSGCDEKGKLGYIRLDRQTETCRMACRHHEDTKLCIILFSLALYLPLPRTTHPRGVHGRCHLRRRKFRPHNPPQDQAQPMSLAQHPTRLLPCHRRYRRRTRSA